MVGFFPVQNTGVGKTPAVAAAPQASTTPAASFTDGER